MNREANTGEILMIITSRFLGEKSPYVQECTKKPSWNNIK